jgi:hypothetical protein
MSKIRRFTTKCHPILERERHHENLKILFHCIIYVNVKTLLHTIEVGMELIRNFQK